MKIIYDLSWAFINKIEKSRKKALKALLEIAKKDVRTTTGKNLRMIMIMVGKGTVQDILIDDTDSIEYNKVHGGFTWSKNL